MNIIKFSPRVTIITTMFILVLSTTSFAASGGAPAKGTCNLPGMGLKVWGGASGDKLNGVIQISFDNFECITPPPSYYAGCGGTGQPDYNKARAIVSLLLSTTQNNDKNNSEKDETVEGLPNTQAFYVEFQKVPLFREGLIQDIVTGELESDIISAFGLESSPNTKSVYLKSISNYAEADILCASDNDDTYACPPAGLTSDFPPFTAMAEITLAVDTAGKEADPEACP